MSTFKQAIVNSYLVLAWDGETVTHADICRSEEEAHALSLKWIEGHEEEHTSIVTYHIRPHKNHQDSFIAVSQLIREEG